MNRPGTSSGGWRKPSWYENPMGRTSSEGSSPSSSTGTHATDRRPAPMRGPGGRMTWGNSTARGPCAMNGEFSEDGVAFTVPEGWKVQREETEEGWVVTLQSPGTAFAMFSMDR